MGQTDAFVENEVLTPNLTLARLICHLRKPENLLTWLVLSAWMKFMGIATHIPSITIG